MSAGLFADPSDPLAHPPSAPNATAPPAPHEPLPGEGAAAELSARERETREAHQALLADAARHALLRRLAPALRHEAAGPLQPIAMAASLLDRRLAVPVPEPEQLRDGVQRLVHYARKAVHAGLDLITWLSPDASVRRPLGEAVQDVLGLMATPLGFEGFQLESALTAQEAAASVPAAAVRLLLPACLWWLTDHAPEPGRVQVSGHGATGDAVTLQLVVRPVRGSAGAPQASPRPKTACRTPGWNELQALALSEGAGLQALEDGLTLSLPATP